MDAAETRSQADQRWMNLALELAERGLFSCDPNPRVGCVLVRDGQLVGQGYHQVTGGPHAERYALQQAGDLARGATCYVTLEPCSHQGRTGPCADALIEAGVARVVAAVKDPNPRVAGSGFEKLRAAGIDCQSGLQENAAQALNPGFFARMSSGLPWVRLKTAISLDGRTALANGESQWITGVEARADVQRWRARSSAILTGIGTLLADNPRLNVRAPELGEAPRQPLRVVLDSELRCPPDARLFEVPGAVWLIASADALVHQDGDYPEAVTVKRVDADGNGRPQLPAVLKLLGQAEVNELHVEAGAALSGAFISAGLADEMLVYLAPRLLGNDARAMFELPELSALSQAREFEIEQMTLLHRDLRLRLRAVRDAGADGLRR